MTRADVFMGEQSAEAVHEKQVGEVDMSVGDQVAITVPQNDRALAFDHHLRLALYNALASNCASVSAPCFVSISYRVSTLLTESISLGLDICTLEPS
jgi:hypothetical protein